jgi:hypothetical protein
MSRFQWLFFFWRVQIAYFVFLPLAATRLAKYHPSKHFALQALVRPRSAIALHPVSLVPFS